MTTLKDNLAIQIATDWEIEEDEVHPHDDAPYTLIAVIATPDEISDSVLASPDMQSIREALVYINTQSNRGYLETILGLTPAVIEWVLGDE